MDFVIGMLERFRNNSLVHRINLHNQFQKHMYIFRSAIESDQYNGIKIWDFISERKRH